MDRKEKTGHAGNSPKVTSESITTQNHSSLDCLSELRDSFATFAVKSFYREARGPKVREENEETIVPSPLPLLEKMPDKKSQ